MRILHRANNPAGHVRFRERERGVDGGDDVIELRQDVVGKIKRTVAEDVALDAGEETEVVELFVELVDHRDLDAQPRHIQPARLDRAAAMIGDPEILETKLLRCRGHFLERTAAVTRGGVAVERAAKIFRFDQAWEFSRRGRLEFAAVLAQFRRNVIEIERAIQVRLFADDRDFATLFCLFRGGIRRCFAEPILVQSPTALQGPAPDLDIVLFAAGKIIEGERIFRRGHHPQVALNAGAQSHARFRRPLGDHRLDERMVNEERGDFRRRRSRHDEIEIAHDLFPAPVTARDADMERLGMRAQVALQLFRFRGDLPELERARIFLSFVDGVAEFFLRRFAEPRQFRHATGDARLVQLRDRADLQFLVKRLDLFRA